MCFIIDLRNSKLLTAKEDIKCYKNMTIYKNKETQRIELASNIFSTDCYQKIIKYKLNRKYRAKNLDTNKKIKRLTRDSEKINKGFHSYICRDNENVECIIPKGTKYYKNDLENQYVSLDIKFIKTLKARRNNFN